MNRNQNHTAALPRKRATRPMLGAVLVGVGIAFACVAPATAQAAPTNTSVQDFDLGTTATGCDWTGDGQADTLMTKYLSSYSWQAKQGEFSGVKIYLNGKLAWTLKNTLGYRSGVGEKGSRVQRIQLANGKVLAALVTSFENGDGSCTVLKAKRGKLVKIGNPLKGFGKFGIHNAAYVKSVRGSKLNIAYSSMSHSLGGVTFTLGYRYKADKIALSQTTFTPKLRRSLKRTWTTWEPKKLYTAASCKKSKKTLRKGSKVQVLKVHLAKDHKTNAVKVKAGKRAGWLKGYTKPHYKRAPQTKFGTRNGLFTQVIYAG